MTLRLFWSSALIIVAGCGDNIAKSSPDARPDGPPPFAEALPSSIPQLVNLGGDVLATPNVQAIVWTGDAMQAQIDQFLPMMAASPYWTTTTSEYGVGALTVLPTLVLTTTPPTTETAFLAMLSSQLDGTHAGWVYDPNTVYAVFLPDGDVLTGSDGSQSCADYGAYHDETPGTGTQRIVYALLPRCTDMGPTIDTLTESASHEIIEAVTDPHVETTPAWGDADNDNYVWSYVPGAETGDYCELMDNASQPLVGSFLVQRTWSNASATAGHDPCVPVLDGPYSAGAPILTETVPIDGMSGTVMTKGVQIPLHTSKTIEVQLLSDQPSADFTVSALDVGSEFLGGPTELTFQWDKTTGHNGDKLQLMITRRANGQFPGSEFAVITTTGHTKSMLWWGYAAN